MLTPRLGLAVAMALAGSGLVLAAEPPPGASSCTGCHAAGTRVDTAVPRLVGRGAGEIVAQMNAFKSGQRPGTVMDRIAKGFTDAEIEAIAGWYAQQK
jgi:cytochrome subunit of sulfide dehydrogenase